MFDCIVRSRDPDMFINNKSLSINSTSTSPLRSLFLQRVKAVEHQKNPTQVTHYYISTKSIFQVDSLRIQASQAKL